MTLTGTSIAWRDLVLDTGTYHLLTLDGWEELPPFNVDDVARHGGRGSLVTPVSFGARSVTVTGWCASATRRDALVLAFRRSMAPARRGSAVESLAVTHAGETLTAGAQLVRAAPVAQQGWMTSGLFHWAVQWRCPDPLRYGSSQSTASDLTPPTGGLALPESLPIAFPARPVGGGITANNAGTAPAAAVYSLHGPIVGPGLVVNSGTADQVFVSYPFNLGADDLLVVDTARGAAFLNGEYRAPSGGSARTADLELLPGRNSVIALGAPGAGTPFVSVTFRSANW